MTYLNFIQINPSSGIPLYLQIINKVREAVRSGALKSGDQLPTIKELSTRLHINPNTVAKAYAELEHLQLIDRRHGIGTFVAQTSTPELSAAQLFEAALNAAKNFWREVASLALDEKVISQALKQGKEELRSNDKGDSDEPSR